MILFYRQKTKRRDGVTGGWVKIPTQKTDCQLRSEANAILAGSHFIMGGGA